MTQAAAQEQKVEQSVSLAALFAAFLIVSLRGIGAAAGLSGRAGLPSRSAAG